MKSNMPISVRAVIIQDGKILVLRREFDNNDTIWTFPGGHVEKFDKDEKEALQRECEEEVNLEIKVGEKIFKQNFKGNINHFYLCSIVKGEAGYGNGPEYTQPEKYHGSHDPEWLLINDLDSYDLKPNELRDVIFKKYKISQ